MLTPSSQLASFHCCHHPSERRPQFVKPQGVSTHTHQKSPRLEPSVTLTFSRLGECRFAFSVTEALG